MGKGADQPYTPPPEPMPEAPTVDDADIQAKKEAEQRRRMLASGMEDDNKTKGTLANADPFEEKKNIKKPTLLGG